MIDFNRLIDNAATASQCDFDDITKEAVRLNVVEPLVRRIERLEFALNFLKGYGCPICNGDCSASNPPILSCPVQIIQNILKEPAICD